MEIKSSLFKNYLFNLSYQILIILLPIITVPYISRVLKPAGVGLNSYSAAIVSYVILLGGLGFQFQGNKVIATSRNDNTAIIRRFWEIYLLRTASMLLALIIYVCWVIAMSPGEWLLYLVQGIGIFAAVFDISWFFQGLEEFKKIVTRNFIVRIASVILMFIFVKTPDDLYTYIFLTQGSVFFGNIMLFPYLRKYKVFSNFGRSLFKWLNFKQHVIPSLQLFIPSSFTMIYTVLNKVMLGFYTNPTNVGFFDNALKIVTIALTILTSLGTVMFPRASYYYSIGNHEKMKAQFNISLKISLVISIGFCAGIIGTSKNFVTWFFGPGYESIAVILPILAFSVIPISLASVAILQYLVPSGRNRAYTLSVVYGAIVNIVLNYFLIQKYQLVGAAVSYVASELTVTVVQLIHCKSILSIKDNLMDMATAVLSALIMLALVLAEQYFLFSAKPIIVTAVQVISGAAVYCGALLLLKNDSLWYLISMFQSKRKKRGTE
ncbi:MULTISPECIES: flippase [unclassified Sporolactobacillus]|uniref:flippase n=1 Tax=unclassified Sporolactobacillus TaxID=2628533 RepID=UPI00236876D6|nr:flippase [Sporolactobacillus sp. CQH2019]MDD9148212.1 flippase [Sporolactobacillus sp. CQH2019]